MKMLRSAAGLLALAAVCLVAACSDSSTPVAPASPSMAKDSTTTQSTNSEGCYLQRDGTWTNGSGNRCEP